jgi:hypothetical protein
VIYDWAKEGRTLDPLYGIFDEDYFGVWTWRAPWYERYHWLVRLARWWVDR